MSLGLLDNSAPLTSTQRIPPPCCLLSEFNSIYTESGLLILNPPFFPLLSGREGIVFPQGTLPSILTKCPSHFGPAVLIALTVRIISEYDTVSVLNTTQTICESDFIQ